MTTLSKRVFKPSKSILEPKKQNISHFYSTSWYVKHVHVYISFNCDNFPMYTVSHHPILQMRKNRMPTRLNNFPTTVDPAVSLALRIPLTPNPMLVSLNLPGPGSTNLLLKQYMTYPMMQR